MKFTLFSIVALVAFLAGPSASADTVAYWRWENGTAGTDVPHTGGGGVFDGTTPDLSGNGNNLSVWEQGGGAGYQYRADVPFSSVPLTEAANNLSVKNTGGGPAMFTNSSVSMPSGVNLETMMPAAFTVEASFKPETAATAPWSAAIRKASPPPTVPWPPCISRYNRTTAWHLSSPTRRGTSGRQSRHRA